MLIQTRGLEPEAPDVLAFDAAAAVREGLGKVARDVRRVDIGLKSRDGVHVCRLSVLLLRGKPLTLERSAGSTAEAVQRAVGSLHQAIEGFLRRHRARSVLRASRVAGADLPPRATSDDGAIQPLPRAPRRVLFVVPLFGYPTRSLEKANQLAHKTRRELHVLRVLPELSRGVVSTRSLDLIDITREVERLLAATQDTRSWCDVVLTEQLPELHVALRVGEFVVSAAERAEELDVDLIVIPPLGGCSGTLVTALARASGRPVLVSRLTTGQPTLLVAADLEGENYPVFSRAAQLASDLQVSIIALHDVDTPIDGGTQGMASNEGRTEIRRERLSRAARRFATDGKCVLTHENDPARAIVKQAAMLDVDTIVVGARPHSWRARLIRRSVAAQVVERSTRSVLVVPVDASEPRR